MARYDTILVLFVCMTLSFGSGRRLEDSLPDDAAGYLASARSRRLQQSCSSCPSNGARYEGIMLVAGVLRALEESHVVMRNEVNLTLYGLVDLGDDLPPRSPSIAAAAVCSGLTSSEQTDIRNTLVSSCGGTLSPSATSGSCCSAIPSAGSARTNYLACLW